MDVETPADNPNILAPQTMEVERRPDLHLRLATADEIAPLFEAAYPVRDILEQQIDEAIKNTARGSRVQYQIITQDSVVGSVVLSDMNMEEATAELSYYVAEEFRGNSYAADAAARIVEFGFQERGLHRIVLEISPENTQSELVAKQLGAVLTEKTSEDMVNGREFPYRIWEIERP